jgi:serine protease inhibitor
MLENLGYPLSGEFSVTTAGRNPVQHIVHGIKIVMDEEGTEGAAATTVVISRGFSSNAPSFDVISERPFIFSIVAEETALFTGIFSGA